jgi:hypothetical protein
MPSHQIGGSIITIVISAAKYKHRRKDTTAIYMRQAIYIKNSNSKSGTRKAKNQKTSHRFTRIRTDFFNQSVKICEIGGKGF